MEHDENEKRISRINQNIIARVVRMNKLSEAQKEELVRFSLIDGEWRTLLAIGSRYKRAENRLSELSKIRESAMKNNQDLALGRAIHEYEREVDESTWENES